MLAVVKATPAPGAEIREVGIPAFGRADVLVKVKVDSESRAEVMQITDIFRAKIVDVQPKSLTIEITGNESKIEKFIGLMGTFGIVDLTRTGKVALPRK